MVERQQVVKEVVGNVFVFLWVFDDVKDSFISIKVLICHCHTRYSDHNYLLLKYLAQLIIL